MKLEREVFKRYIEEAIPSIDAEKPEFIAAALREVGKTATSFMHKDWCGCPLTLADVTLDGEETAGDLAPFGRAAGYKGGFWHAFDALVDKHAQNCGTSVPSGAYVEVVN